MFGTPSFGSSQPEVSPSSYFSKITNEEIIEQANTLYGSEIKFSEDDFLAVRRRADIILKQNPSLDEENVLDLAVLDRAVNSATALGLSYDRLLKNPENAVIFIKDEDLKNNSVFVATVLAKAEDLYTSGTCTTFTDALAMAAEMRTKEHAGNPHIEGTIDDKGVVTVH